MTARLKQARIWDPAPDGWYVEPEDCSTALAQVEAFHGSVVDPAAGKGNVIRGLAAAGVKRAVGFDLVRRAVGTATWFQGELDFLQRDLPFRPRNIVTNPPYGGSKAAEAFIRRSLEVATEKVCVFVSARFLYSERRARGLFREHPPTRIWFVTPRPSVPPGDFLDGGGKAEGGTADYVWLVWDLIGAEPARTGWLVRPGR